MTKEQAAIFIRALITATERVPMEIQVKEIADDSN
jgi:hypothetical protein